MFDHFNFFGLVASALAALDKCDERPVNIAAYLVAIGYPKNVAKEAARIDAEENN